MAAGATTSRPTAHLEHTSHGRVRVRLPRTHRSQEQMTLLRQRLLDHAAVAEVETNARTGSILVTGGQTGALEDALNEVLEVLRDEGPGHVPDAGVQTVVDFVKRVDGRVVSGTGGRVSLRWAVPASFIYFGLREAIRQGLTVGAVPWYVLIYYGVDSFLKLYPEHAPAAGHRLSVVTPP